MNPIFFSPLFLSAVASQCNGHIAIVVTGAENDSEGAHHIGKTGMASAECLSIGCCVVVMRKMCLLADTKTEGAHLLVDQFTSAMQMGFDMVGIVQWMVD